MDRTNENGTEHDPDQRRQPSPEDRQGRSDDRTGSRNARKVMSEDDRLASRHIIHIIAKLVAGNEGVLVEPEHPPSQPAAIGVIGDNESDKGEDGNEHRIHG